MRGSRCGALVRGVAATGLGVLGLCLSPNFVAYQDAAALAAVTPEAGARWRTHLVAAPARIAEIASLESFDLARADGVLTTPGQGGFVLSEALPPPSVMGAGALQVNASAKGDRLALPAAIVAQLRADAGASPAHAPDGGVGNGTADSSPRSAPSLLEGVEVPADGATPKPVILAATTPANEAPLAIAALPVERFLPKMLSGSEGVTLATRIDPDGDGKFEVRLTHRLMLTGDELERAKKCMAEAVYFEARGEPVRGQYAVAQVVMNRVRSEHYPNTVCGVVYQNKHWHNRCQFSFACDGIPDRVFDKDSWAVAQKVAEDVLVRGAYLPEIGGATHYHATYVRPYWLRDMRKEDKIGQHIFYRVKAWSNEGV